MVLKSGLGLEKVVLVLAWRLVLKK